MTECKVRKISPRRFYLRTPRPYFTRDVPFAGSFPGSQPSCEDYSLTKNSEDRPGLLVSQQRQKTQVRHWSSNHRTRSPDYHTRNTDVRAGSPDHCAWSPKDTTGTQTAVERQIVVPGVSTTEAVPTSVTVNQMRRFYGHLGDASWMSVKIADKILIVLFDGTGTSRDRTYSPTQLHPRIRFLKESSSPRVKSKVSKSKLSSQTHTQILKISHPGHPCRNFLE